jgi:hypothetical protein
VVAAKVVAAVVAAVVTVSDERASQSRRRGPRSSTRCSPSGSSASWRSRPSAALGTSARPFGAWSSSGTHRDPNPWSNGPTRGIGCLATSLAVLHHQTHLFGKSFEVTPDAWARRTGVRGGAPLGGVSPRSLCGRAERYVETEGLELVHTVAARRCLSVRRS